jgi:hypothetical protein
MDNVQNCDRVIILFVIYLTGVSETNIWHNNSVDDDDINDEYQTTATSKCVMEVQSRFRSVQSNTGHQVLTRCAPQFQDDRWGGGPAYEHPAAGLVAPGTAGCTRGPTGALVFDAALPAPLQPSISPPPCCHHLRLQVMRPRADPSQAGRHHVSSHISITWRCVCSFRRFRQMWGPPSLIDNGSRW